jgi:hypothetical protein
MITGLRHIVQSYEWTTVLGPGDLSQVDRGAIQALAGQVCIWGGVPQDRGYADAWKVLKSAILGNRYHGAPMNSGWTKVASFATDGLPNGQTIWDSRVSTSLIWRLDQILRANVLQPEDLLALYEIGLVGSEAYQRGKPRYREYNFHWPNGYGKWPCHLAGGQLVRDMVRVLNHRPNGYPSMPTPSGGHTAWDVFGVGLVLFMDGR